MPDCNQNSEQIARDPHPRSREVFPFHRSETLQEWLEQETQS